ncbi:hypothetical protein SAMN05216360_10627 [Methylobacterium phyllostachyos]|uniref:Uncharacterized protein n=1 Tax=Methylobacterium phyllostachyos TaxID=582672 RepID=A0A1G9YZ74_9HYPH|nr:hypothetical protein SAMN05216360_10627 [Methylobacterium phyllostachyos]
MALRHKVMATGVVIEMVMAEAMIAPTAATAITAIAATVGSRPELRLVWGSLGLQRALRRQGLSIAAARVITAAATDTSRM